MSTAGRAGWVLIWETAKEEKVGIILGMLASLAWTAGQAVELKYDSDLGRAILGCKSLGSGLHWMCQYFPLLQDASCLRLDVNEDWSMLSYKILDPTIWPRHEDAMYTLGIYSALIRAAAPEAWSQ